MIFLSSINAWKIASLVDTGRIELDVPVERWVQRFLDRQGVAGVPLTHLAAARSYQLNPWEYRDPADRLLIATAIELGCPLVTYDANITQFGRKRGRQHGFTVAA